MRERNKNVADRNDVQGDVIIDVNIINNNQPPDGQSQEIGVATVTCNGAKPPPGQTYDVWFTLEGSSMARFVDTMTNQTRRTTDENGQATVSFVDTVAEIGTLYAAVKVAGKPFAQKNFAFD